jgi:integrase
MERNHPWKEIWATAIFSGMRNGEIYALKPEDIDFDSNTIHVRRGFDRKIGVVEYTKSNYDRIVDLAPPLKRVFKQLVEDEPDREFLLPRIPEWDTFQQARVLRQFLGEIGLPSIRFHDLRAAWCTILLNNGEPSEIIRSMGGWKDLKTFQRYIRQSGIKIKGALKILERMDWLENT